jgi:predicted nucleotidyltransferase
VTDALRSSISADPRIAYALVFGSTERGTAGPHSDLDLAIGLAKGVHLSALEIGEIVSRIEAVARTTVDLVILDTAPPGLAYRVFRDGRPLFVRDAAALVDRKARAVLEYLDFQPIEALFERNVLDAGADGR